MFAKLFALGASAMIGIGLAGAAFPPPPPEDGPAPPPKKKGEPGDFKKAYDLLRRLRSEGRSTGRPEERLRDWTERASKLYRQGVKAADDGDHRLAHEYSAAAHDLARAVDHARNASQFERPDPDLPPPPSGPGPGGEKEHVRHDLRRAYDRIHHALDDRPQGEQRFYADAARDLYNAARRDAEAGRNERAGELARAADAMSHVVDHLGHAADRDGGDDRPEAKKKGDRPEPKEKGDRPEPKKKGARPEPKEKGDRPEPPKEKGDRPDDDRLPPPLD